MLRCCEYDIFLSSSRLLGRAYVIQSATLFDLSCRVPTRSFEDLADELSNIELQIEATAQSEFRQLDDNRGIGNRLSEALQHPKYPWRTLERVAFEAGVSEEVAADLLRGNDKVRFSKGKSGNIIVGPRSRVD